MKVVFDTNALIAAFLTEGVCAKLLARARKRDFALILCEDIVTEFESVLARKFAVPPLELAETRQLLFEAALEILPALHPIPPICRDPQDDRILACARDAGAEMIVTGDEDLLILTSFHSIKILSPRNFESLFPD